VVVDREEEDEEEEEDDGQDSGQDSGHGVLPLVAMAVGWPGINLAPDRVVTVSARAAETGCPMLQVRPAT